MKPFTLSIKIALRYFFSAKSHGAVNVISAVSVAGVAVATAAIIVVLSVFNGFSFLARDRFSNIDPPLMVIDPAGKVFSSADSLATELAGVEGVVAAVPTLSGRGLITAGDDSRLGVIFKGVSDDYDKIANLDEITDYAVRLPESDTVPSAAVAVGAAARLGLLPGMSVDLYTLRRLGRINPANPAGAFFSARLGVERILRIDQIEFDADHIIIPINVARSLLQYDADEASAIEIALAPGVSPAALSARLAPLLQSAGLSVINRDRQHADTFRMISIEKWVTFAMLIFIMVIAAFNIVSTLSLMVIEKRENMHTLRCLGAPRSLIRSVFSSMGALITVAGGLIGILVGIALSLAQQWGGFVRLNGDASNLTITEYPVRLEASDILAVSIIVLIVACCAALTTRLFTRKID